MTEQTGGTEQLGDEASVARLYRSDFSGPSLGTEEELAKTLIEMPVKASNSVVALIRYTVTGEVLVLITRDIGAEGPERGRYTIELRTTPTEMSDDAGWHRRRRALKVAIWGIEEASKTKDKLKAGEYERLKSEITNPDHQIVEVPLGGVALTGKQSTVGIPEAQIGAGVTVQQRAQGKLHPLLWLPWYRDQFTSDVAVAGLDEREKIGYALVMSAVLKLADIWTRWPDALNRLEAKNAWVVRPRTPPINILDSFEMASIDVAMAAVNTAALPVWADPQLGTTWADAREHIIRARPMGGHPLPLALIHGGGAMLFEYREAPVNDYPFAFWAKDEYLEFDKD